MNKTMTITCVADVGTGTTETYKITLTVGDTAATISYENHIAEGTFTATKESSAPKQDVCLGIGELGLDIARCVAYLHLLNTTEN